MKIISQEGITQEIFDIEKRENELYGYPLSVKKPMVFLGKYDSAKRTIEVMAEAVSINSKNKNTIYTMPKK